MCRQKRCEQEVIKMTTEERLDKLEENYHAKDKQFAAFMSKMDMYIQKTDQQLSRMETRMDRFEDERKETRRMMYASAGAQVIGVIAILIAIYLK
jgi:hypothetical protein